MDSENRDKDKKHLMFPVNSAPLSVDQIKSVYICEGISAEEIAERYKLPVLSIKALIEEHKLPELRSAYVRDGLSKLQNVQLGQAQKLMDLENSFKRMRIIQLEKMLEDYAAYYARHGHFYKTHPISGEILKDSNNIPMQIFVPNISKEIRDLKESVSLSEGLKNVLSQIDDIINKKPSRVAQPVNSDDIEMDNFNGLFKKRKED